MIIINSLFTYIGWDACLCIPFSYNFTIILTGQFRYNKNLYSISKLTRKSSAKYESKFNQYIYIYTYNCTCKISKNFQKQFVKNMLVILFYKHMRFWALCLDTYMKLALYKYAIIFYIFLTHYTHKCYGPFKTTNKNTIQPPDDRSRPYPVSLSSVLFYLFANDLQGLCKSPRRDTYIALNQIYGPSPLYKTSPSDGK